MPRTDKANTSRYWWHHSMPGLSLLRADFTTHEYPPHMHEALVVAVTERGGSIVSSRGTTQPARPRTLLVFNPVEPHAGWMGWSERWCYRSLYLERAAIDSLATGLGLDRVPFFTSNAFDDPPLIDAFLAAHRALERDEGALEQRERLLAGFGQLFSRHGQESRLAATARDDRRLRTAIDMIRSAYAENPGLAAIGEEVGLTEFQLIGLFKRGLGITPHAYLTQVRLNVACHHLRRRATPAEAALAAGFCDQSAMTRHFKRCYGMTPQQLSRAAALAAAQRVR